jgi:hypothetical protein
LQVLIYNPYRDMENKEAMIKSIYENIWEKDYFDEYFIEWVNEFYKYIYIWDVLDYIDKNLFRKKTEINWMYEISLRAREQCVITLYNYFIWNYKNPIERLDDDWIEFIYNLITNK